MRNRVRNLIELLKLVGIIILAILIVPFIIFLGLIFVVWCTNMFILRILYWAYHDDYSFSFSFKIDNSYEENCVLALLPISVIITIFLCGQVPSIDNFLASYYNDFIPYIKNIITNF